MAKKILVVDDNPMSLNFLTNLLEKQGHEVAAAEDGVAALDIIASFTPDIMFIDLILPRIGGDLLCRLIRKKPHMKDCYLVIISGALAEVDYGLAEMVADTYIAKGPFNRMARHVLACIEEAGRPANERSADKRALGLEGVHPRQMTRELILRKRHLEAMLESVSVGVLEISAARIVYANSAAVEITGLPLEKLINLDPLSIFDSSSGARVKQMLHSNSETPLEIGLRKPIQLNGRLVSLKVVPVKGALPSSIILIKDVTSSTRMEIELQHARKMEAIGTIASGVAHNFRNNLAGILANNQIIQMDYKDDEKLTEITDRINSSVYRGEQLVNRLLEFSYKEIEKEFQPVDLVALIQATNLLIQDTFDKRIDIQIKVPDSLTVQGDTSGLSSVLMNLCNNASQAMPEGGILSIEAKRIGGDAMIVISDTGAGMDADTLEKCFDPFFTTKAIGKGTGLGLSTAYGIVKSHNGLITVKSTPDRGTTFKIVLPLVSPGSEDPSLFRAEKIAPGAIAAGKIKRLLVVDDEHSFLKAITQLLETLGYSTISARNGIEAIDLYEVQRPDLVLMDIGMPQMDGITCARQIIAYDPDAQIILISGYDLGGQFEIKEADRKLFKGYLTKPVGLDDLSRFLSRFQD